jgi:hypothetical protein
VDREVGDVAVAGDGDVEVADLLLAAGREHAGAGLDGDADVEVGPLALAQSCKAGGREVALGPGGARVAAEDGVDVDGRRARRGVSRPSGQKATWTLASAHR